MALGLLLNAARTRAQQPVAAPPLGQAAAYGLLSGGTITGPAVQVLGRAGASQAISSSVTASAGVDAQGSGTVPQALADVAAARAACASPAGTVLNGDLTGRTLAGGRYTVPGAASLAGGTLTLTGDTATVFIVDINGALTVGSQAQVLLRGVLPRHVFWSVAGNLSVGDGASLRGVALLAPGAAATLTGTRLGCCTLLGGSGLTLTGLSPTVGHNQFFAPLGTAGSCAGTAPCLFKRPASWCAMAAWSSTAACPSTTAG